MRVAVFSNTLPPEGPGGAEANAAALAEALATRHDVLMLTGARGRSMPGAAVARLPGLPPLAPDASPMVKAAWHLRDQWLPRVHRAARRTLRRFRPDVVHSHSVQGISAGVFTAIAAEELAHVHTAHDLNLLCMRVSMTRAGDFCGGRCASCVIQRAVRPRLIRQRLDYLIAPSEHILRRHLDSGYFDPERAITIRQGTGAAEGRVRGEDSRPLTLGYIGSLAPVKGVETLLAAFRDAPAEWRLMLAGSGPLEQIVRQAAAEDSRIRFAGRVDGEAKDAFYDGVELLVIPSEWEENAPLVAVEAAVRGLPAVVSDRGGLPELPEVAVFAARDRAALLNAVREFVEPSPSARLAAASRRLLEQRERFLWPHHVRRVEQILEAAADASSSRPRARASGRRRRPACGRSRSGGRRSN
jgi:glycosyltransferase involved in cell wall biosynthesis